MAAEDSSESEGSVAQEADMSTPYHSGEPKPLKERRRKRPRRNMGEKAQTPESVFRENDKAAQGFLNDQKGGQKLVLQLASQIALCKVPHGLLWASGAQVLRPAQLMEIAVRGERALAFAPSALDTAPAPPFRPRSPEATSTSVASSSTAPPSRQPPLNFHSAPPNLILALVQWALFVHHEARRPATLDGLGPDDGQAPETGSAGGSDEADQGGGASKGKGGPGARRDNAEPNPRKRKASGGRHDAATDCTDGDASGSIAASASLRIIATSTPPSSPLSASAAGSSTGAAKVSMRLLPVARGCFADVRRGSYQSSSSGPTQCVYKVNRPALTYDGEIEHSDDEGGGPIRRCERELEVLRSLESLQGSVLPKLHGKAWVETIFQPDRTPALVLEDVGVPISWGLHWPATVPTSRAASSSRLPLQRCTRPAGCTTTSPLETSSLRLPKILE